MAFTNRFTRKTSSRKRTSSGYKSIIGRKATSGRVLEVTGPQHIREMNSMIAQGPMTIVLVFMHTCGHCRDYMPIWKELSNTKSRKAHMISIPADTYQQTPLAAKKEVTGVPTVLFVDKEGHISEAEDPRNREVMTNAIQTGVSEKTAASNLFRATSDTAAVIPGTMVSENPLPILPGETTSEGRASMSLQMGGQRGGNPWAAFLLAAKQAAPAAALLGAYSALPKRSSGLRRATRRLKKHRK